MLKIVLAFLLLSGGVSAYSDGAPEAACDLLTPNHGVEAQNPDTNPYRLAVSTGTIKPGGEVNVTLISDSQVNFKGFLIVAKQPETNKPVGTLMPMFSFSKPYVVEGLCGGAGLTHSVNWTKTPYYMLPFVWKSPSDFEGLISFYATAVQERETFWPNFEGEQLVFSTLEPEDNTVGETEPVLTAVADEAASMTMNTTNATVATPTSSTDFEFEEIIPTDEDMFQINSTIDINSENNTSSTNTTVIDDDDVHAGSSGVTLKVASLWMFSYLILGGLRII